MINMLLVALGIWFVRWMLTPEPAQKKMEVRKHGKSKRVFE